MDSKDNLTMTTIKIFLASSEELRPEREMMASLANSLNTVLEPQGIQVIVVEWENLDASMGILHKQEDYNEKLRNCEMCLVLYWTKFGMYTKTELDTAYSELKAGNNPKKLYVYFKTGSEPSGELKEFRDSFPTKYGHFFTPFENFDTLKAHFLLQFMEYQSQALQNTKTIEVKNGKINIGGKEYVDLQNVPFAGNNEEYNFLQKSIKKTQKLLAITEPDDPDYAEYASDLQEMKEKLSKMESSLWDTALMITRLSNTKCSERLQRAMDLFENGDCKGAQAILNEEEIEKDVKHNLHLIELGEEGKKGLKVNIEEYGLKASILSTEMPDGWLQEQCKLYDRIIELSSHLYGGQSLETAQAMMDAVLPYYLCEDYRKLYELTEKALNIRLDILGEMHLDTAQCYNDLGVASGKLDDYQKYLDFSTKGLNIRLALNASDALLAESYNTVGVANSHAGDKTKHLEYELKSLELRKKAFGENSLETAQSYSEVGSAYAAIENYDKYLEYSLCSLEIKEKIVGEKHPDTAQSHNNVGDAYACLYKYPEAIIHLKKAVEIQIATAGKFTEGALINLENLAAAYELNNEIENSLDCLMETIDISEKINGEVHQKTVDLYERTGRLLDEYGDKKTSLNYLYHALDVRFKIAENEKLPNGPLPTFGLADLCHKIGSLHFVMRDYEKAERMVRNSVNIISDVDKNHPALADWSYHLGMIYGKQGKHDKALECFKTSLNSCIEKFGEDCIEVAEAYERLGHVYSALKDAKAASEAYSKSLAILKMRLSDNNEEITRIKQLIAEAQSNTSIDQK